MDIDDFLLITSEQWTEIQDATTFIQTTVSDTQMQSYIAQQEWSAITQVMEDYGLIQSGTTVTNARMFNTGEVDNNLRMWVILASG